MCPGLAEQRTGRGNLRRGGACTTRRPVRCEECGRCDMHCETMLEKGRHCHSDSEEEDGDEQEDEEEHADAGDGGAEADDEEEEDTEEMLIKDLVEFFSLSKSFAHYTYKLTAASTPSATTHSNAYRLLTRITAQVGEILKARGAADDVVEQWHAAEAGPALGDVQERAAELLDSLPVRCPGHQAVAMLMCAASPSKKGRALPNAEIDFVSTRDVIAGRKLFAEIIQREYRAKMPEAPRITRAQGGDEKVDRTVRFLTGPDNAQYVSWATKKVRSDGKVHEIPAASRLKSVGSMYYDYTLATTAFSTTS